VTQHGDHEGWLTDGKLICNVKNVLVEHVIETKIRRVCSALHPIG
jgi:hypothetical protein